MAVAELIGSMGGVSCAMSTSGGVLACACLMAVLRVVIAADYVAGFVVLYAMKFIEMVAWTLSVEPIAAKVLVGKVGIIFHTLGTAFVLNVSGGHDLHHGALPAVPSCVRHRMQSPQRTRAPICTCATPRSEECMASLRG